MIRPTDDAVVPLLVTAKEAAKMLAVSERTLWTLGDSGTLPRVPIGPRCYRYDVADLLAWIAARKAEAAAERAARAAGEPVAVARDRAGRFLRKRC